MWVSSKTEKEPESEEETEMKVGDKVKVLATADKYVTGEKIPDWVKGKEDEIMQIKADGKSVLLKGIYSWVWAADVEKAAKVPDPPPVVSGFKVGDKIKILATADKYVTGEKIPERLKGATDEIMQIKADGKSVLLKGIYSWVFASDVEKV